MRYDVGRFRRPMRRGAMEQMASLISLGDGSTLSLDFTAMSSLDSRFTFSRSSPATFINSSGLVRYADHNLFLNTAWLTSTTPTAWSVSFGTGTTTWNNNGSVTMTAGGSSVRPFINFQTTTVAQGLPMTFGYLATNVTGSPAIGDIISSTGAGDTFAINGVTVASSTVVSSGDVVSCTFSPASGSVPLRIGPGVQAGVTNMSVTASRPQWNYGTTLQQYQQNTSTSAQLHSARFDYDPSTLAPRGLLIEGSATNIVNWSESFATSGSGTLWNYNTYITRNATQITGPDGGTSAYQFNETTDNQIHRISTSLTGSAGAISISVWAKVLDTNTPRRLYVNAVNYMGAGALFDLDPAVQTGASGSAVATSGTAANRAGTWVKYPNNWYRVTLVGTYVTNQTMYLQINRASSTTATDDTFAGSTSNGLSLWGCQVEQGSGASSYIPTGASTVQRAADDCLIDNISTAFGFNASAGTILISLGARILTGSNRAYTFLPASGGNNQMFEGSGVALNVFSGGSFTAQIGSTSGATSRICAAYSTNDFAVSVNGGAVATDTSGAVASSLTRVSLGGSAVNSAAYNFGPIAVFKYWPTRLPNATLQALTA